MSWCTTLTEGKAVVSVKPHSRKLKWYSLPVQNCVLRLWIRLSVRYVTRRSSLHSIRFHLLVPFSCFYIHSFNLHLSLFLSIFLLIIRGWSFPLLTVCPTHNLFIFLKIFLGLLFSSILVCITSFLIFFLVNFIPFILLYKTTSWVKYFSPSMVQVSELYIHHSSM